MDKKMDKKMEKMENKLNGCLGIMAKYSDFLLPEGFEDSLPTLYQQDNIIYEYNQFANKWSEKSCTIFSAMGAISDLFNIEFSAKELREVDSISYLQGRMQNSGWWVSSAVKMVADRWNDNHKEKVAYYRIDRTNDELIDKITDKGYTLMTNYNGNSKYTLDYLKDAVLDGNAFGNATYGHAINIIKKDGKLCVKDSEKGRKTNDGKKDCNIYELKHPLSDISCFGTYAYLYTKVAEDNLEEIKRLNQLKTECNNCISQLGTIWHLVNDDNFKSIMHYTADKLRIKIQNCDEQLAKYM